MCAFEYNFDSCTNTQKAIATPKERNTKVVRLGVGKTPDRIVS